MKRTQVKQVTPYADYGNDNITKYGNTTLHHGDVNLLEKVDLTDLGVSKHMTPEGVATLTYLAESIQERKHHLKYLRLLS